MSPPTVESLLGPEGPLAAALDGYERRPEQLEMARAVERAFRERSYLLAEAGTGTGKTLAYLVPAALSGRKVVVSTATKTLQEQVFFKDIAFLKERVGLSFEAAYLKGRSNYLCLHRFEAFDQAPMFATRDEANRWPQVREWAHGTTTGDRAELDLPDGFSAWPELSTTPETCLGTKCPQYEPCFVTQVRRRAEKADVVVVNHALFFADLAIRSATGEGILPAYDAVVFDEAHALEDVATDSFGMQLSSYRFEELSRDARKAIPESDERFGMLSALAVKMTGHADAFFRAAPPVVGLRSDGVVRLGPRQLEPVRPLATELVQSLGALASFAMGAEEPDLAAIARRGAELASGLDFIQSADSPEHVYWAERRGRGLFLRASPIDVAEEMRRRLYASVDTAVFTSATLRAGGRFDYFARRLGLDAQTDDGPSVRKLAVPSPFDFSEQAGLYLSRHTPEPNAPGFIEAVAEEIVALTEVTGGRAFALFTSLKNMELAHQLTRHRLPFQVLLQGERPKSALLDAFRKEPSVLFASHSFWEGVDVPGDALSLVIIDKLPFAPPSDPLTSARIEQLKARGEDAFQALQLPQAALALRQGFGRLIRTRRDRGIVAVLDSRLVTKRYGRIFIESLPPARRLGDLSAVRAWFGSGSTARGT